MASIEKDEVVDAELLGIQKIPQSLVGIDLAQEPFLQEGQGEVPREKGQTIIDVMNNSLPAGEPIVETGASTSKLLERFPWGSQSIKRTRMPSSERVIPTSRVRVVLPTPPFGW
jgi:hypothetical protein